MDLERGWLAYLRADYLDGADELVDPVGPLVQVQDPGGVVIAGPAVPQRLSLGSYRHPWVPGPDLALGAGYLAVWTGSIAGVDVEGVEELVLVEAAPAVPVAPIEGLSPWTWRVWGRLPAHVRAADARQATGGGYPLARYLSLLGDQAGEVEALYDRLAYLSPAEGGAVGATSDLVDPATADAAWLPWLAWLAGVRLDPALTAAAQRDVIAAGGARLGSKQSIVDVVRPHLTGDQVVLVHAGDYAADMADRPWSILVRTRLGETSILTQASLERRVRTGAEITAVGSWAALNPDDVGAAIHRAGVIPAGAVLRHDTGTLTWRRLREAGGDTTAAVEALGGSWAALSDL